MHAAETSPPAPRATGLSTMVRFIRTPHPQWWVLRVVPEFAGTLAERFGEAFLERSLKFHTRAADLYTTGTNPNLLVKRIRPQKAADYLRRSFYSQARREHLGSVRMAAAEFSVPESAGYAFNLLPWSGFDSLFFCRFLDQCISAAEFLQTVTDSAARQTVIRAGAHDLALMLRKGLFHKDAHFGNILLHPATPGRLYWIDNDVVPFRPGERARVESVVSNRWMRNSHYLSVEELALFQNHFAAAKTRH